MKKLLYLVCAISLINIAVCAFSIYSSNSTKNRIDSFENDYLKIFEKVNDIFGKVNEKDSLILVERNEPMDYTEFVYFNKEDTMIISKRVMPAWVYDHGYWYWAHENNYNYFDLCQ